MNTTLNFLNLLARNNNREWFADNKTLYENAKSEFEEFVTLLIAQIKSFDNSVQSANAKDCIFRIFRDVRFSKNKEPYKTNFGAYISKGGKKSPYAGYYFHVQPGESFAGGGLYMPETRLLSNVRKAVYENPEDLKQIIKNPDFISTFGSLRNEKLKTAPKGFPKDFEDIELLKYKSFVVTKSFTDTEITKSDLIIKLSEIYQKQIFFNKYFNTIIDEIKILN